MGTPEPLDRRSEWFVPRRGPLAWRVAVGLLFLPYTGMVIAFTVIGAVLSPSVAVDRVIALALIYFLALGIGAHALDAVGSRARKPWGQVFARRQLVRLAAVSIVLAYAIGGYYMLFYVPALWPIALAEGFFLLAYNLEWFDGRFHTDAWFAVSWGALPTVAGYVMQTGRVSLAALVAAGATGLLSLVEIKASRPYKALKLAGDTGAHGASYEAILRCVSGGSMLLALALLVARWHG